ERRVARVEEDDGGGVVVGGVDGQHVLEGHGRRVMHRGTGAAVFQQRLRYDRRGPHDHVRRGQPLRAPQGDEVVGARAGTDERDHGVARAGVARAVAAGTVAAGTVAAGTVAAGAVAAGTVAAGTVAAG